MTPQDTMRLALELLDRQWQCSAPWSLEEAQDVAEALRSALAQQGEQPEYPASPMTAKRAAYFMERFKKEEKLLGPNEQAAVDFVLEMLAQQGEQQPVGTIESRTYEDGTPTGNVINWAGRNAENDLPAGTKLYAGAAPAAQPLSDEQIHEHWYRTQGDAVKFAQAIERHHGIGVQK